MGDVAGSPMFTYISLDDYRIVREQLFGDGKRNPPTAPRSRPPPLPSRRSAHIGLTETAAQQSGREVKVLKLKADAIPKAKILNQTDGLLKAVGGRAQRRNPRRNPVLRRSARNHQPV